MDEALGSAVSPPSCPRMKPNEVLLRVLQENLGVEPAEVVPAGRRPGSSSETCCMSQWAPEGLKISQEERSERVSEVNVISLWV